MADKRTTVLPGFGLSMGITVTYLVLLVLIPLSTLLLKTSDLTWEKSSVGIMIKSNGFMVYLKLLSQMENQRTQFTEKKEFVKNY